MVNDALAELFPTIDVENMPLELFALMGTNVAMAGTRLTASVGDNNLHQLFNPAGSGHLVTIQRMYFFADNTSLHRLAITATALTTDVGNVVRRDTRNGVAALSIAESRTVQQAAGIAGHQEIFLQADTIFQMEDTNGIITLFPGTGLTFGTTVFNTVTVANWQWKERLFEPAEANF